ncbi:hydrogenase maturation nickel metallochaperone HypA [Corynebacterium hindlerae]|uniref:Hydrogenase maturation nickel metallochaperone HypA n=1 Tax=Corynebacterium hindlerae TaxID=699041 RepID=A0A7G5FH73_9CORY|nr:hydrogenase maturation nickel metallochaperone HypA [Corynebacterium hindlerae]QMV85964.1 hydrogenase maturation nickel metallochaperone HypA [Corynebacterium hindlerae]QTH60385.1 hydrogenase maturation nickel metallochaperone HypA [Corynebacterium hindlerae]
MHEVALSTQLARAVTRAAGDAKVLQVRLSIGALRQVVPETLDYAWGFVVKDTPLADAELDIHWVPLQITCSAGHVSEPQELDFTCPICGETAAVTGGNEFTIIDIEVIRS